MRNINTAGFYVYEHWRLDTAQCFYVGKGFRSRAWNFSKRSEHHKRVVAKASGEVSVAIVADNLTERDAFALETERIAYWRDQGAPLVNKTNGGEGTTGLRLSAEAKARISEARRGKPLTPEHRARLSEGQFRRYANPDERTRAGERSRGRKASPETIEKRVAKLRGRKMSEAFCKALGDRVRGRVVSEGTRAKLRAAQLGRAQPEETKRKKQLRSPHNKPVLCLNSGVVYISAAEAARDLGVHRAHVAEICRGNSSRKSARGYNFKYACGEHEGGI